VKSRVKRSFAVLFFKGVFSLPKEIKKQGKLGSWGIGKMIYFAYGIIAAYGKDNPFFFRNTEIVSDNAWVKGVLYDTGLGFPALTEGEDIVKGKLILIDKATLDTLTGMAKQYDGLNPPYRFLQKIVTAHSASGAVEAVTFIYENGDGLFRLDEGAWI
jgi:gamma-glutamylcyclotransferase (GGCT)/AIG2-like uncharacterized protein YtfP